MVLSEEFKWKMLEGTCRTNSMGLFGAVLPGLERKEGLRSAVIQYGHLREKLEPIPSGHSRDTGTLIV